MGHKVYFFGDIHFSAMHPWLSETGDKFIEWFCNKYKDEYKDDYIVFLGDVMDKHVNPGSVVKQAFRLFEFCNNNFKKTYVLTGNHDKRLYHDVVQNALQFLECFENIHVIEDVEKIDIENKSILALPHIRINMLLSEYYTNNFKWDEWEKTNGICDVGIGHWEKRDPNFQFSKSGVDTRGIPAKKWVIGHLHTRPTEEYTGSIWPCNPLEQICNFPRCIKIWSLDTNTWEEELLPTFLIYKEVDYPNRIVKTQDGPVKVYTINGIKNLSEAEAFYKNSYIKGINRYKVNSKELKNDISASNDIFLYKTNIEAFDAMVKETNQPVSENVLKIIREIL